jgi:hypothetical protein
MTTAFDPKQLDNWTDNCQFIYDTYTMWIETDDKEYLVVLRVQHQTFPISIDSIDKEEEANWLRAQLAKALDRLVQQEMDRRIAETLGEALEELP